MLWSNQSKSARMSILYITAGALIDVWTLAYYFFIMRPEAETHPGSAGGSWFWVAGFFFTGLALLSIGLFLGSIGRAAAKSEVVPVATLPVSPVVPVASTPVVSNAAVTAPINPVQSTAPVI